MSEKVRQPVKMKRFLKEHQGFLFGYIDGDFVNLDTTRKVDKTQLESTTVTSSQRETYKRAKDLGYFDFPRKIKLSELAKAMGTSPSTLCVKLQMVLSRVTKRVDL